MDKFDKKEAERKAKEEREKSNKSIIDRLRRGGPIRGGPGGQSSGSGYKKITKDQKALEKLFGKE